MTVTVGEVVSASPRSGDASVPSTLEGLKTYEVRRVTTQVTDPKLRQQIAIAALKDIDERKNSELFRKGKIERHEVSNYTPTSDQALLAEFGIDLSLGY
jgi:hypothetical protein